MINLDERRAYYEGARSRGELVRLVQLPIGRRYLDANGTVLTRTFKVSGGAAERLVLSELPCSSHEGIIGFPWETCPVCADAMIHGG